ncbi:MULTISPECIES: hypothetical protein [Moorena]|uniref:hypothetical protein n=1 Tax=Moorena TaxID=1155738 RepID=UPI001056997F|nr:MULTISPECIES: hypothetical protein [Moorena]NEP69467.1 hypothetical protein [Moorena sp. SIO3A5]NES41973.1 hypothetical protein [Moorena sp. SIO2C4]
MNRSRVGILPARKYIETGKMPVPRQDAHSTARCPFHSKMPIPQQDAHSTARCPFHKTLKIIPLLSNAKLKTQFIPVESINIKFKSPNVGC